MAETQIAIRILNNSGWVNLASDVDAAELIAEGAHHGVWVDICGNRNSVKGELNRFLTRCPHLKEINLERATKGGSYPPQNPPKAKAFQNVVFARAYWLGATDSSHEIKGQEVHILAGKSFAITLRYPVWTWDMERLQKKREDPRRRQDGLELQQLEVDVRRLRAQLGRDSRKVEDGARPSDLFGLEVAIAILDQITDSVFESLDAIRRLADELENNVLKGAAHSTVEGATESAVPRRTLNLRRLLRQVRWSFLPLDEISELRSGPFLGLNDPAIESKLDDLCRESDRAIETVRDVIEQVQQVVELSDSLKTEHLAKTTSVLTIAATVLLVPTLIAGVWGMNFARIPGAGFRYGFWLAILVLVVLAAGVAVATRWYLRRPSRSATRK